jgi:hypothetical protein
MGTLLEEVLRLEAGDPGPIDLAEAREGAGDDRRQTQGGPRGTNGSLSPTMPLRDPAAFEACVAWMVKAYGLQDRWPACWSRHPGLVEELRGLWKWHLALRTELSVNPNAICSWHDAFWRTSGRALDPITRRCLSGHRDVQVVDVQRR